MPRILLKMFVTLFAVVIVSAACADAEDVPAPIPPRIPDRYAAIAAMTPGENELEVLIVMSARILKYVYDEPEFIEAQAEFALCFNDASTDEMYGFDDVNKLYVDENEAIIDECGASSQIFQMYQKHSAIGIDRIRGEEPRFDELLNSEEGVAWVENYAEPAQFKGMAQLRSRSYKEAAEVAE